MITFGKIFEAAEEIEARVDKGLSEGILIWPVLPFRLGPFFGALGRGGLADNGMGPVVVPI
jgi:hypothetical protein